MTDWPGTKVNKSETAEEKPHEGVGALERLKTGFMDPVYGAMQDLQRLPSSSERFIEAVSPGYAEKKKKEIEQTDKTIQEREKDYQTRRGDTSADWLRVVGTIGSPLNYVGLLAGGPVGAAAGGAMTTLLQPVTDTKNFAAEKAKEGLFGAAFGSLGTAVTSVAGKAISPIIGKVQQELLAKGVELTPGQLAGGILRRAEEAAKSFPILGSFIRGAEGRSIEAFDKSVINQALEPIGEKLPTVVKAGREAVDYAHARLSNAYDNLLPQMKFSIDNQFSTDMANVRLLASEMPKQQVEQFETIVKNRIADRLQPTGSLDGRKLKQIESELTQLSSQYRGSSDAAQRELASRINDVRATMRDALQRQNPSQAETLKKINAAYAMFTRVEGAASRRATSQGVFTPGDLLAAIKSADKSVRKGDFARGDALMQEYGEFGQLILPGKLPDSGTPERMMWDMLGLGTALYKPQIPAALLAASAPYTKPAGAIMKKYVTPGPARQAVGQAVRSTAPATAPAAAEVGTKALGLDELIPQTLGLDRMAQ